MKSIEDLDRWIGAKVKGWSARLGGGSHPPAVLEIHRDILEEVRGRLEPKGQGRYFFAYDNLVVRLGAADAAQESLYNAAFGEGETLASEIRALLAEAGTAAAKLAIDLQIAIDPALAWTAPPFRIDYFNRKQAPETPSPAITERPAARLVVTKGEAGAAAYPVDSNRVNIGRLQEVFGEKEGLRRTNHVAFSEAETTVSREHAYLTYEPSTGRFRICDDRSQRGTSIFREGRRIEVPKASRRGTQLRSGDEIHLGDARLRFEIE